MFSIYHPHKQTTPIPSPHRQPPSQMSSSSSSASSSAEIPFFLSEEENGFLTLQAQKAETERLEGKRRREEADREAVNQTEKKTRDEIERLSSIILEKESCISRIDETLAASELEDAVIMQLEKERAAHVSTIERCNSAIIQLRTQPLVPTKKQQFTCRILSEVGRLIR